MSASNEIERKILAYVREDWLARLVKHVTEGHLGTLVLINLDLWVIDVGDVFQFNAVLNDDPGSSDSCVGSHLDRTKATTFIAFLPEL